MPLRALVHIGVHGGAQACLKPADSSMHLDASRFNGTGQREFHGALVDSEAAVPEFRITPLIKSDRGWTGFSPCDAAAPFTRGIIFWYPNCQRQERGDRDDCLLMRSR